MRSIVIYTSTKYGNTKKVAIAMAEEIGADLHCLDDVHQKDPELDDYNLIALGTGIKFLRYEPNLRDYVPRNNFKDRNVFLFMSCGSGWDWIHDNIVKQTLLQQGANLLGQFTCLGFAGSFPLSIVGGINRGHPNQNDIEQARYFARRMHNRTQQTLIYSKGGTHT